MSAVGFSSVLAGALQVSVPSYGLRLVRRFGAQNVGWFLVTAFASLALMHLFSPAKLPRGMFSGVNLDTVYSITSVLLVIGMGHLESLFSERQQSASEARRWRRELEREVGERTTPLVQANKELLQNIARREQSERVLKESEALYRFLFTENPLPMLIVELGSFRLLGANNAALRQHGFTFQEMAALTAPELLAADAVPGFIEDLAKPCPGIERRGEWSLRRKGGPAIEVEITALDMPYGEEPARLLLAVDVSERRRRELQSRETLKMDLIRQIAGGMAHHYHNLLAVVAGHTDLLLHKDPDPKTAQPLQHISAAANRAARLTRQLLAAGGWQRMQTELVDLNRLIRRQIALLRRLTGRKIRFRVEEGLDLPPIIADTFMVEQIMTHLVLNARDAMPEGGRVTIMTESVEIDESKVHRHHDARVGKFVSLTVADTGCGMTPEVQAHVFEPFFTTRAIGQAIGLGLASVHGAVKQHSGWIEFTSRPGEGTEFRVFLPCAPDSAAFARAPYGALDVPQKETILLVEPEDRTRELARFVLNRHGYHVIESDGAATTMILWERQAAKVDLVLTELKLSDSVSGPELIERLRRTNAGLKVLYTTKPAPDGSNHEADQTCGSELVAKPYAPDRLLQAVEATLNGRPQLS